MTNELSAAAPRIIFVITEDWYFWTHRLSLARAAKRAGFDVVIATRVQEYGDRIAAEGLRVAPIHLRRESRNPVRELLSIVDLVRLYQRERPAIVHHVTVKPVLYGSIAAWLTGVPAVINAVAGLGHVFTAAGVKAKALRSAVRFGYKAVLAGESSRVIFQTEADRAEFVSRGIIPAERATLIRGAGVNLSEFTPGPEAAGPPIIMFAGRLLWSKGVGDLVEAGRILARAGRQFRIALVGMPDFANPMAVTVETLNQWAKDGVAEWWGKRDDMAAVLREAAILALPTFYGEGVPKILLEASATGRPVVTSDLPGCRDAVRHGTTGFIVPAQQPHLLADVLGRLLDNPALRAELGARGRELVEREFTESAVVAQTLALYRSALSDSPAGSHAAQLL